ncbi:hypothetical protein Tco_0916333 [Tanacetum coccineum]
MQSTVNDPKINIINGPGQQSNHAINDINECGLYYKETPSICRLPSPGFNTGSPSVSVNIEPLRADEEHVLQFAEVTTDSGGSPKPELFVVHPGSVAARIKDRKCKTKEDHPSLL